ncbi:MAG: UvrD-helicase domain-containing protein [Myxococcales bacterium]|nr:UvrD-helicase domain-containing protein [Myxococcales bacterium]
MSATYHPRPRVLMGLPPHRHAVIEASAGTGKTYTLEHLVIELLLSTDVTLDQILVVTFTEKAAAELRLRLRRKLSDILHTEPGPPPEDPAEAWRVDAAAQQKLARALLSFDAASISTIHAFCHRMLAENAFDNHRLFKEELVDGKAAFTKAFFTVLRTSLAREEKYAAFLEAWLDEQPLEDLVSLLFDAHTKRGVVQPVLHLDRLAGALQNALKLPLNPNVLRPALVKARVGHMQLQAVLKRVTVLRQHLERYHKDGRLPALLAGLSREEEGLPEGLLGYLEDRLTKLIQTRGVLENVRDGVRALRAALVPLGSAVVQVFLPIIQRELARQKAAKGQLDFDDMLALLRDSLARPGGRGILESLRARYRFALIDEFQDTDEVQWEIFRRVFLDRGARGRLFVIGDPKQAIYGFRGADVKTYLAARSHIEGLGGSVIHLTLNYRSSPGLIDAVNLILRQKKTRPFFTGEIRYEHPVRPGDRTQGHLTERGEPLSPVVLFDVKPKKSQLAGSAARRTLAWRISKEIRRLLDPEEAVRLRTPGSLKALAPDDIFVLTRSTREGLEVGRALRRAGVPYAFYKQDGLFQTREAQDIRAVLAAIAEPGHKSRRIHAWRSPFFAAPLEALATASDLPATHPFMERLLAWKELAEAKDYDRLFVRIVEDSGIIERELFLEDSERELTNYLHIFEILQEEASRSKGNLQELLYTLTAFVEQRRLPEGEDGNVQRLESERDAVQIMTMHKAKGLEAPVVFLFGGFDEARSSSHTYHAEGQRCLWVGAGAPPEAGVEALEEDQRLLYVALTRAKARLYLPFFGRQEEGAADEAPQCVFRNLSGTYRQLNEQLEDVVARKDEAEVAPLFTVEAVPEQPFLRELTLPEVTERLPRWRPPARLLVAPGPKAEAAAVRRRHLGRVVTSYSRIKAEKGGYTPPDAGPLAPAGAEEVVREVSSLAPQAQAREDLPGGTASGRFLHEVLEQIPFDLVADAPDAATLAARPDVRALFLGGLRKYDRDPVHLERSVALIYGALRTPLRLGPVALPTGLAGADRAVPEMEFLFPVAGEGFVKGFVDLVFEHGGKTFLLDWKSDLLPSYAPAAVDAHVAENYALQAELYTLALLKVLGIHDEPAYEARFGGAVYVFVRGMADQPDGATGLYFARPSWHDVLRSEATLQHTPLAQGGAS